MANNCDQRRAELLRTFSVPTLEDAAESLGPVLSAVVLNTMSQKAQLLMGVQRPLSIVPDNMWIAPQTRLDGGRIVLTVPDRLECLQAFTHQAILEVGAQIEMKWNEDKVAAVEQAKRDTELFEKFECAQRIKFSVKNEHLKQTRKRELERDQMMSAFQDERDKMTQAHKVAIETSAALLRQELQLEADRRLQEEVGRLEREGAESECRWQLEVAILKAFIADAQQRQDLAVGQTKTDYLQIFKKLFVGFELELQSQRDTMQCKHMAELLHAICIEKELAFNDETAINTDSNQTDTTTTNTPATPPKSRDSAVPPMVCPNVLKFRRLFANMLRQYKDFVEWSLDEAHCQAKFLIPLETHLQTLMLEQHHTDDVHFDCCGGKCLEKEGISFIRACTKDMIKEPIFTAACRVQSEPSIAEVQNDVSPTSSSLSCFHLDGTMYASNQHYLEIVNRVYPTEDLNIDWEAVDKDTEHDESRLYSVDLLEHFQSHINAATIEIEHELRTVTCSESIRSDIVQRRLKRLVNQVLCTNYPRNAHICAIQHKHIADQSDLKMLSVVDSVELMHQHQQHLNHFADIYVNPCHEFESQSEPQRCTIETQTECPFVGHEKRPTSASEQVIRSRSDCLMLSNDEYMRYRRKSPVYMGSSAQSGRPKRPETIWNRYRVTTDTEWQELLARVDADIPDKRVHVADQCSIEPSRVSIVVEPPVRPKRRSILRNTKTTEQTDLFDSFSTTNGGCLTTERLLKRMEEDAEIVELMNKSITK